MQKELCPIEKNADIITYGTYKTSHYLTSGINILNKTWNETQQKLVDGKKKNLSLSFSITFTNQHKGNTELAAKWQNWARSPPYN